jgi:hypothetical protein
LKVRRPSFIESLNFRKASRLLVGRLSKLNPHIDQVGRPIRVQSGEARTACRENVEAETTADQPDKPNYSKKRKPALRKLLKGKWETLPKHLSDSDLKFEKYLKYGI